MRLEPFLLEQWLEQFEKQCSYNLACSYGPTWSVGDLLELMSKEERDRFFRGSVTYTPSPWDWRLASII